ncbi:MAG TPA: V-type ATP synthase subunit E [Spirochaetia bacterium]|nr:V-type ATP synthase subunit E [Spirochaetia bacterium]
MEEEAAALVAEIDREAEAEKERILSEARDKARQILADADARIRSATEEASRVMQKQARVDEDRLQGEVRLEAQAERLQDLRRAYGNAFAIARERIEALTWSPRYAEALRTLISEALEKSPQAAVLTVANRDVETCREALKELAPGCRLIGAELPPGSVIVSSGDGKVTVDNSLDVRLAMAEAALETQITRCLNG